MDKLLTAEDVPDNAVARGVPFDVVKTFVEGRNNIREVGNVFGEQCGQALTGDFAADHLLTDGAINAVEYANAESSNTVMVTLVPGRLDHFLNRDLFSCESQPVRNTDIPNVEAAPDDAPAYVSVSMRTEDAPAADGVEAFREIRDVVTTTDAGEYQLQRNVIIHGFGAETTMDVSYTATTRNEGEDPISPEALAQLDEVFVLQAQKLSTG